MNWDPFPIIKSNRICLRRLSKEDVDSLFTIFSDPQVMRYWSTPPLAGRDAAIDLLHEIQDSIERRVIMKWGLARLTDNVVIGTTTLFNLNLENGRAEIGYALGRAHWGHGYMHEALQALIAHAFQVFDLRRLEADVDPRNNNSIRTLERLGFQREGFLRERWCVSGEIQDALIYGLLRREWVR
jgi:RimJ/RimL family protein N-acetyltransferase